ncbi:MAG: META domain-containing protein [Chloroflexi bacterium]|nr:META domain-containing protein [Chloroflexota bacterium]
MNIKFAIVIIIAVLAVMLVACGGSGVNVLRNTVWELESLTGNAVLSGTTITLEFSDEQVSGLAGCNQYGGSYQAKENNLSISNVFATEMGCMEPTGILEQETAYLTTLGAAATYQITTDRLEVYDAAGTHILIFVVR